MAIDYLVWRPCANSIVGLKCTNPQSIQGWRRGGQWLVNISCLNQKTWGKQLHFTGPVELK